MTIFNKINQKKKMMCWTKLYLRTKFCALLSISFGSMTGVVQASELSELNSIESSGDSLKGDESALMLKEEMFFLQTELIELLEKYDDLKEKYMQTEVGVVLKMMSDGKDSEGDLSAPLGALKVCSALSRKQAAQVVSFCNFLERELVDSGLGDLERYKIDVKLDLLKHNAQKVIAHLVGLDEESESDVCRVLSVDDKLQVVVVATGFSDGVRIGDVMSFENGGLLKIVSVRSFVSAGVLLKTELTKVAPGMIAYRVSGNEKKRD